MSFTPLLPVVRERAQLADSFTRRLVALGLERRVREPPSLGSYLADRYPPADNGAGEAEQGQPHSGQNAESPPLDADAPP